MFVYSIVKITRFYYYQTLLINLFEKFARCTKLCGLFFLDCAFRVLIGYAGKLRSHGFINSKAHSPVFTTMELCPYGNKDRKIAEVDKKCQKLVTLTHLLSTISRYVTV